MRGRWGRRGEGRVHVAETSGGRVWWVAACSLSQRGGRGGVRGQRGVRTFLAAVGELGMVGVRGA